ncbi:MAG: hypothetical protein QGI43_03110 [Gemmatimonadota bacterium]|nr:hypothetical protein [Gemmatimonadota bacterium]
MRPATARTQSESSGRMALYATALGTVVLAALWFAGRAAHPGPLGFRLDDAWIHMVYGRGLATDGFLSYNPGIPSTGCTSPAWAAVLALVHRAGFALEARVAAVLLAGASLHLLGIREASLLAARISPGRWAGPTAGALTALSSAYAVAAFSGMEVMLCALLLLATVRAVLENRFLRAGILAALAGLARPESAAVLAVLLLHASLQRDESRAKNLARLALPPLIAGAALMAWNLRVDGTALPATYHAKASALLAELPGRTLRGFRDIVIGTLPFAGGIGWLALVGVALPRRNGGPSRTDAALPLAAGVAFLLANLALIDPVDPAAFYHRRYLLPAVPLLLTGVAIGADALGRRIRKPQAPLAVLVALAALGSVTTLRTESLHLHHDTRNIHEVQRSLGEWLHRHIPDGRWVAASDAGAIRYFSERPTVDLLGLNTPGILREGESFVREHPVAAVAWMPAWFRPMEAPGMEVLFAAETAGYTVTSNPKMGRQWITGVPGDAGDSPTRLRFSGYRSFEVDCLPWTEGAASP